MFWHLATSRWAARRSCLPFSRRHPASLLPCRAHQGHGTRFSFKVPLFLFLFAMEAVVSLLSSLLHRTYPPFHIRSQTHRNPSKHRSTHRKTTSAATIQRSKPNRNVQSPHFRQNASFQHLFNSHHLSTPARRRCRYRCGHDDNVNARERLNNHYHNQHKLLHPSTSRLRRRPVYWLS